MVMVRLSSQQGRRGPRTAVGPGAPHGGGLPGAAAGMMETEGWAGEDPPPFALLPLVTDPPKPPCITHHARGIDDVGCVGAGGALELIWGQLARAAPLACIAHASNHRSGRLALHGGLADSPARGDTLLALAQCTEQRKWARQRSCCTAFVGGQCETDTHPHMLACLRAGGGAPLQRAAASLTAPAALTT